MSSASRKRPAGSEADPVQPAKARSSLECGVCLELFDAEGRKPRVLVCGHSLCTACCGASQEAKCPSCRREVPGGLNKQPVNFALLGTIEEDGPLFECSQCHRATYARLGRLQSCLRMSCLAGLSVNEKSTIGLCANCGQNKVTTKPMLEELDAKVSSLTAVRRELARAMEGAKASGVRCDQVVESLRHLGLPPTKLGEALAHQTRLQSHRHIRSHASLSAQRTTALQCLDALPKAVSKTALLNHPLEKSGDWLAKEKAATEALDGTAKELDALAAATKAIVGPAEQLTKALADVLTN